MGHLLARNALVTVTSQALQLGVLVSALPPLVRALGPDGYGTLNLVLVLVSYLALLNLGIGRSLTRFMADALGRAAPAELAALFWMSLSAVTVLGVLGAGALALAAPYLAGQVFAIPPSLVGEATRALRFGALGVFAAIVSLTLSGALEAHQRFVLVHAVQAPWNVLNTLLPLLGAWAGAGIPALVGLVAAKNLLLTALLFALCWVQIPEIRGRWCWDGAVARTLFVFGGWTAVLNASPLVMGTLDRLVVGMVLGMTAVTYYAVPQQITNTLAFLPVAIMPVLYPAFSRLFAAGRERVEELHREAAGGIVLVVAFVSFVSAAAGREVLVLWMGPDFARSERVLQILAAGLFLVAISSVTGTLLQATGYVRDTVAVILGVWAAQAVLLPLLLRAGGAEGAALASAATQGLTASLCALAARRRGLIRLRQMLPPRVVATCAVLAALLPAALLAKSWLRPPAWAVLGAVPVAGVVYLWAVWRFGLTPRAHATLAAALAPDRSWGRNPPPAGATEGTR